MQELRQLVDGYAVAADERDAEAFRSLFADDAVLVVVGEDGAERSRYEGADAIAAVPGRLARYERTLHLVSTHRASVDGDTATGTAYCEAHHRDAGGDRVLYLRYDDGYVRRDGRWRIADRVVRTLWSEQR